MARPYPVCLVAYAVGDYFVIKEKPEDVANIAASHGWIVPARDSQFPTWTPKGTEQSNPRRVADHGDQ